MFKEKIFPILCILLIVTLHSTVSIAFDATYVWSSVSDDAVLTSATPIDTVKSNNSLKLESASAVLMDQNTGTVLYNHNMHEKLRPASVTKVMTILLIMEALDSREN